MLKLVLGLSLCTVLLGLAAPVRGARPPLGRSDKKTDSRLPRLWTDATGQYQVRAALLGVEDGKVRLKKTDGTEVAVPIDRLSEADQQWLARQAGAAGGERAAGGDQAAGGEWPGWLGPNRDGKSPDRGLLKQWPSGGPKLLWKATGIGKGFSSVAVAGGTVYITGEPENSLMVYALDLAGNVQWKTEHGPAYTASYPGSRGTPTIDGENLYLLSGTGLLGCFDAKTGKRHWAKDAREFGGRPGGWGYAESVLILGPLAVFKPGGSSCIVALDKQTGKVVWTSRGFSAGPEYSSCLAVPGGSVPMIVTGTREGLVCVNANSGALVWSNRFAAGNTANCPTPAYADGHVFWANGYGKGGICMSLGRSGATEAWTTRDMECHHGGYVIHEGYIYGNNGNGWACLELRTGRRMWGEKAVGKGSLCWADDMLYLFSERGGQAALATCSPKGLEIKGQVKVDGSGPSWAHPVVAGGRLYLRYDTNLYCFDVKSP